MKIQIEKANISDAQAILELQKLAYRLEAEIYDDYCIPPLKQTVEELQKQFGDHVILKAVLNDKIIGTVRAYEKDGICHIGRLAVDPVMHNQGLGTALMQAIEAEFNTKIYELFAGHKSEKNLYLYKKLGYETYKTGDVGCGDVKVHYLRKIINT